jgi:hypothetical protein
VVAPLLRTLLTVTAPNVSLANLRLEHTAGVLGCGLPGDDDRSASAGACDIDLAGMAPGAINVINAPGVSLTNISAAGVGGYAITAA